MTFGEFCWALVASILITSAGRFAWYVYQLRQRIAKLTEENQRMRRYLRLISKRSDGDDMPFLPLEVNDD
jgi:hypothetical protein